MSKKKKLIMFSKNSIIIVFLFVSSNAFAQKIIGGRVADPSAALELQSTTKGFLPPRLTIAERDAISSPAKGLIIYNTSTAALNINLGTASVPLWTRLGPNTTTVEDVLSSTNTSNALSANQGKTLEDSKVAKANVLELDNTTSFSPSTDYQPATKKYADDLATTVEDLLTATSTSNALSANQGRILEDSKLENSLSNAHIFIGDNNDTPTEIALSGDANIANNGVLTIADNAVDGTNISLTNEAEGDITYYNGTNWQPLTNGNNGQILTTNTTAPHWVSWPGPDPSYSTTEQDTGKRWIDNKTIFQITLIGHTPVVAMDGIDTLISIEGTARKASSNAQHYLYSFFVSSTLSARARQVGEQVHSNQHSSVDIDEYTITLFYTKT